MALHSRATVGVPAVAAVPALSSTRDALIRVDFSGLTGPDNFSIFIGRSATPPTTKAGLTTPLSLNMIAADAYSQRADPITGFFSGTVAQLFPGLGGAAGDLAWILVFEHTTAFVNGAPTTPADVVLGPFTLAA